MTTPLRPVVVSECLGFGAVRYNGQMPQSRFVEGLRNHLDFVHTCPATPAAPCVENLREPGAQR